MTKSQIELIFLTVAATLFVAMILRWHLSKDSNLDLQYLFIDTETKMFSIFKFGQVVALFVSTWVLIRETSHDRLGEWLFTAYMLAWGGANIANRIISKPSEPK
jgi:hypothetical protein